MRLYDRLPVTVTIDGVSYPIDSDYRLMVRLSSGIQGKILTPEQCIIDMLPAFYLGEEPPANGAAGLIEFYNGCQRESGRVIEKDCTERAFCFDYDAAYIAAAFKQQYDIDLFEVNYLHWWKFLAYFRALGEDTRISKIMGYRMADVSKMHQSMKEQYLELKEIYALPEPQGDRLASNDILKKLQGG